MNIGNRYLVWALGYAVAGMCLGIFMAASQDHTQHVTHAHVLLIGFVVSFIYAVIHRLWLGEARPALSRVQYYVHHAGAIVLFLGLLLLYGNMGSPEMLEPLLALASITVLSGLLLMLYMVIKATSR